LAITLRKTKEIRGAEEDCSTRSKVMGSNLFCGLKEDCHEWNVDSKFPNITLDAAIQIARQRVAENSKAEILHKLPQNLYLDNFSRQILEQSWKLSVTGNESSLLRSSRLICVSKNTGAILYDGSLNDEG
jgi:hypothetical protein